MSTASISFDTAENQILMVCKLHRFLSSSLEHRPSVWEFPWPIAKGLPGEWC
jgi:hypothetical protein